MDLILAGFQLFDPLLHLFLFFIEFLLVFQLFLGFTSELLDQLTYFCLIFRAQIGQPGVAQLRGLARG